jgi:hypothetical protein
MKLRRMMTRFYFSTKLKTLPTIRFLRVSSSDMFLCFELVPGAVQHLGATAQAPETDLSWVTGDGLWADGTPIPFKGVNFLLPVSPRAPNARYTYLVRVKPTGIDIREMAHGVRPYRGD